MRVLGTTDDLAHILRDNRPDEVLIAMPSAPGDLRRKIVESTRNEGIAVKTLPALHELISGDLNLAGQIRPVQVEDVLGREQVEVDLDAVSAYVRDRAVLVTGAGARSAPSSAASSRGSASPAGARRAGRVGAVRDRARARRRADFPAAIPVLADCGDRPKMRQVFERYQPAVVFHAAAYKHVPMLETNPFRRSRTTCSRRG